MLPLEQPDRIQIAFDDHRLVANAGLLLPVTLAQRLSLSQLVDRHVDPGRAPGRANAGDKMLTLVASALAGGDFSITVRQHESLRSQIDAIPEADWTPIPYWMEGAADVVETTYVPFESKPDAATVRLIVRRVKPTPDSQLALFANYSYHAFITDREGDTLELEADHRRHAEIENAIRDLKYGVGLNHLPAGRFPANPEPAEGGLAGRPGHGPQSGSLDNARRPGRATGNHQDPPAALLRSGRTAHPLGPASHPASAPGLALAEPVQQRSGETARPATPFLTAPDPSARLSTGLAVPRQAGTSVSTAAICPADLPLRNHLRSSTTAVRGAHSPHPAESLRIKALQPLSLTSHPCLGQRDCIPSVDSGLGVRIGGDFAL